MGNGENAVAQTLFELFFDLTETLCSRYPALSPFEIRREKVGEVFLLVRRINAKIDKEKGIGRNDTVRRDADGNIHIRRKATNDDWY